MIQKHLNANKNFTFFKAELVIFTKKENRDIF